MSKVTDVEVSANSEWFLLGFCFNLIVTDSFLFFWQDADVKVEVNNMLAKYDR